MMKLETHFLSYLALAFGIVAIGMSGIFVKWAGAPGAVSGFYRMAIAAAVVALPFGIDTQQRAPLSRRHILLAILAGLFFAGDIVTWNTAVLIGTVANATLFANTSPIWVGIGALIVFKERLRPRFGGGLLIAMLGVLVILGQDLFLHFAISRADWLGLAAGVFYGAFFLTAERARDKLSPLGAWWISAVASACAIFPLAILLHQPFTGYPVATYANLFALALITQVGGWLAVNYALGHLPASLVSPTLLGQPVVSALAAVPLLGQPLSAAQIVGGALVLVGILIVHRSKSKG
jgi:drug/metabolite transporter (DMT)-like permease